MCPIANARWDVYTRSKVGRDLALEVVECIPRAFPGSERQSGDGHAFSGGSADLTSKTSSSLSVLKRFSMPSAFSAGAAGDPAASTVSGRGDDNGSRAGSRLTASRWSKLSTHQAEATRMSGFGSSCAAVTLRQHLAPAGAWQALTTHQQMGQEPEQVLRSGDDHLVPLGPRRHVGRDVERVDDDPLAGREPVPRGRALVRGHDGGGEGAGVVLAEDGLEQGDEARRAETFDQQVDVRLVAVGEVADEGEGVLLDVDVCVLEQAVRRYEEDIVGASQSIEAPPYAPGDPVPAQRSRNLGLEVQRGRKRHVLEGEQGK